VSADGPSELSKTPLQGTQISMMVFPLIPADIKHDLPNRPEIQFIHPHSLGRFAFVVQKSTAGFNVSVRPLLGEQLPDEASIPHTTTQQPAGEKPAGEPQTFTFENSAPGIDPNLNFTFESGFLPEIGAEGDANAPLEIPATCPEPETAPRKPLDLRPSSLAPTAEEYIPEPETPQEPAVPAPVQGVDAFGALIVDRRVGDRRKVNNLMPDRMEALFTKMAEAGASDLHLSVSMPPMIRKDGRIQKLECGEAVLTPEVMRELLTSIMPEKNREEFARRNDSDFAYEILGLARFRCNVFTDRKGMGGVFRIIPTKILTAEQLGLSKAIMDLCSLSKGLVVATGPTGSGKSTTLCAMIDAINKTREDHIITIEDPIEFVHDNQKCLVNQREVHNHTDSFKDALRAALREDPDVLFVGEMSDLETISIALETAETGHLVFGTLHTTTAASTVDRIIDQFPPDRQQQIRVMLSESLKGVIAQTLLPKKGGGRVAALEVLIVTPAVSNLIREGKTFQIPSAMHTGRDHGMVMLNDALFDLVQKGLDEPKDAYVKSVDKAGFEAMLTRAGFKIV
jgi:twitching motility protein PilT